MLINELLPCVLRDIDDGVFVIDLRGHITYMNPQIERMLGMHQDNVGQSYAKVFLLENPPQKENDAFHQFILDAVYDKQQAHSGTVPFFTPSGNKRFLHVTSSFLKSKSGSECIGIVLVVSDVTETEVLKQKRNDACLVFSCVASGISLYLIFLSSMKFLGINVSTDILTLVIVGIVIVISIIMVSKTDFSWNEFGLRLVNPGFTFMSAITISAVLVAALIALKLVLLQTAPGFFEKGAPFWKWDFGVYFWVSYIIISALQEFLAINMLYGSIKKMFDGKNGSTVALVLSSLLFGAIHIGHSFTLMIGAIFLLGFMGRLYEKHQNIWGISLIHYVLGQAVCCLGFA